MDVGYTANFGPDKGGLATVKWVWLDDAGDVIGSWVAVDGELEPDSGIYYIFETAPSAAFWLAFKTGDAEEIFLVMGIQEKGIVFNFDDVHSGKTISYRYFSELNAPVSGIITANIIEFMSTTGIYLPLNVSIPLTAVFIKAWTDDVIPIVIGGAIDFDVTVYTQVPRTGPYAEEVDVA